MDIGKERSLQNEVISLQHEASIRKISAIEIRIYFLISEITFNG